MSQMNTTAVGMRGGGAPQAGAAGSAAATESPVKPIGPGTGAVEAAVKIYTPQAPKVDLQEMNRQLREAVAALNDQMSKAGRSLGFSVDTAVGVSVITVTNKDTGELVRQIPGEDVLRVAHSIESLKGVIYSKLT